MILNEEKHDLKWLIKTLKKLIINNWKKVLTFAILSTLLYILGQQYIDKQEILEFSHYIASQGYTGYLILTIFGILAVNIGLPILTYEMALGYIVKNVYIAILISITAKLLGTILNIFIARRYFKSYIQEKIQHAKIFRALRKLQQQQSRKSLFLLALLEAPMLIKNFFIAIFNYGFKDICMTYFPVSVVQSVWYVVLGSEMEDFINVDQNQEQSLRSQLVFWGMLVATVGIMVYLGVVTKNLMKDDEMLKKGKYQITCDNDISMQETPASGDKSPPAQIDENIFNREIQGAISIKVEA